MTNRGGVKTTKNDDSTVCPFCGQQLLNVAAVARLASEQEAFAVQVRQEAQTKAQEETDARIKAAETAAKTELAKQLRLAAAQQAKKVDQLARLLKDEQQGRGAKIEEGVRLQLASAEAKARDKLQRDFNTREKQLQSTLRKLQAQNDELQRRFERLSPGDRGDFNEEELIAQLRSSIPDDEFEQTKHGQRGADIFQRVRFRGSSGGVVEAGLIIYECKDTLRWSNRFVAQIKNATRLHGTDNAVLVSRVFPSGHENLAVIDGVVVVDPARCVALAMVMRRLVIELYRSEAAAGSRERKSAGFARYISSVEFKQSFAEVYEDTSGLRQLLAKERQSHQKVWTQREHVYQSITDTITQIDARFKLILESSTIGNVRSLRPSIPA